MRKQLLFIGILLFAIELYADVVKVVPNFLIKADGGVGILMKTDDKHRSDTEFNASTCENVANSLTYSELSVGWSGS